MPIGKGIEMSQQTCTTTDGSVVCNPATSSDPGCGCSGESPRVTPLQKSNHIRTALLLGVACLTSPCCVPLIAPIIVGLLTGTPLAIWFASHMAWLYGGLTLVSAVSFLLAWRYANQKSNLVRRSRFALMTEIQKCLKPINSFLSNRPSR
jgi:hypothetical protein